MLLSIVHLANYGLHLQIGLDLNNMSFNSIIKFIIRIKNNP